MRAYDCTDPAHGNKMHITGPDDAELIRQVQAHRDQYHKGLTDDQIKDMVSKDAFDE